MIANKYNKIIILILGPKGWCLTGQGQLLHFIVDTILDKLDTPIFEPLRDKLDIHLEQAFFCLYQHPSKKNKVINIDIVVKSRLTIFNF